MNSLDGLMIVGLTGQTGAGKSTVSRIFSENGFKVINADIIARKVVTYSLACIAYCAKITGCSDLTTLKNGISAPFSVHPIYPFSPVQLS